MFSFKEGRKIGKIIGGKKDGKFIYITDKIDEKNKKEIILKDGVIIPLPNKDVVEKIYISAPSGAGKSTFAGDYINQYKKMFKDDEVYILSSITEDKVLDKYDPIRIPLDESFIEMDLQPEEIENSLMVFDDTDTIQNARIRNTVGNFRDWLLEQGRHFNIRLLITSHLLSNYKHTRRILNEATAVVVFPKSGSGTYHIKNFLKTYCGFDKAETKKFLNLNSRWVMVYRSYPQYVLYQHGCYFPLDNELE